jgi:hypothetical protein
MKLFNAIAAAAVIGTSLITATPAEARNGWVYIGKGSRTQTAHYVKPTGTSGAFIRFQWQTTGKGSWNDPHLADCRGWRTKDLSYSKSTWDDALPGTMADSALETVCR